MNKVYQNTDFTLNLPYDIAEQNYGDGLSLSISIYTVNRDESYDFTINDNPFPEYCTISGFNLRYMLTGVINAIITINIPDNSLPDNFYNKTRIISTDYYFEQTNDIEYPDLTNFENELLDISTRLNNNYYNKDNVSTFLSEKANLNGDATKDFNVRTLNSKEINNAEHLSASDINVKTINAGELYISTDGGSIWFDDFDTKYLYYDRRAATINIADTVSSSDIKYNGPIATIPYVDQTKDNCYYYTDEKYDVAHNEIVNISNSINTSINNMSSSINSEINSINSSINEIKDNTSSNIIQTLAVTFGATYNSNNNTYSLNGINDITESLIAEIIRYTAYYKPIVNMSSLFRNTGITNFCQGSLIYTGEKQIIEMPYFAYANSLLLKCVLYDNFYSTTTSYTLRVSNMLYSFAGCINLIDITGKISLHNITARSSLSNVFQNCRSLVNVSLYYLNAEYIVSNKVEYPSISFSYSPNISSNSISTLVNNVEGRTKQYMVELEDSAFDRLCYNDEDVIQASENHTNVILINSSRDYKMVAGHIYHLVDGVWE